MKKKAIVIGGSRGIGKAIADSLRAINCTVVATSRKELDTSNLDSVKAFIRIQKEADILVLNTGGPPVKDFFEITEEDWQIYFKQLFLGFCLILQNLTIRDDGYIFLITSSVIKEPDAKLILSSCYRIAFSSIFKILSKSFAVRNISCINIAPGPMKTDRLINLIENMKEYERSLPMKRIGNPNEIGNFVKSIVENDIKYLTGVVINFDGGLSNYLL